MWSDRIKFYPFNSVVIVLGGDDWEPADPPLEPNNHGVFRLAIELYQAGYDVHMYNENEIDRTGAGRPYNEVLSARNQRGVTKVAVYGYSHGGGSTFLMVNRLNTQHGINVNFTAYIDAVQDDGGEVDAYQERRRPTGSLFHANYYQHGVWTGPFRDWGLDGGPVPGANFEIDIETQPAGSPWYRNATHYAIDDPWWDINGRWVPGRVYTDLRWRLQNLIKPW